MRWLSLRTTKPRGSPTSAIPSLLVSTSAMVPDVMKSMSASKSNAKTRLWGAAASKNFIEAERNPLTAIHLPFGATAMP
jgi:hypothetical protein